MSLQLVCYAAIFLVMKENRGNLYQLADCHTQQCQIVILRKAIHAVRAIVRLTIYLLY